MERASSAINLGIVCLANRWLERRWSTVRGTTTELRLPGRSGDCLTQVSPEYHVDYGEVPLAARDLGQAGWSESASASGASVVMEQAGDGVYLRSETFLSHQRPGMVRQMELTNTGAAPVRITRLATEILPLDRAVFPPLNTCRAKVDLEGNSGPNSLYYRALGGIRGTILIGSGHPEGFALYEPHPSFCAPVWVGEYQLGPGKSWAPPCSTLFWTPETPHEAPATGLEGLHADWMAHRFPGDCSGIALEQ
jgi:hypothetical protein